MRVVNACHFSSKFEAEAGNSESTSSLGKLLEGASAMFQVWRFDCKGQQVFGIGPTVIIMTSMAVSTFQHLSNSNLPHPMTGSTL